MERNVRRWEFSLHREFTVTSVAAIGLLALFWASIALASQGIKVPALRAITAACLVMFVPGSLLVRIFGLNIDRAGAFVAFSVGLSFAVLGILTPLVSVVLPPFGIGAPLSVLPLSLVVTAVIVASLALIKTRDQDDPRFWIEVRGPFPVLLFLFALPTIAGVAALLMNQFTVNTGMFLFILAVELVVLLSATRYLPENFYPVTVFLVSVSVLLHRNLVTKHVVGADIQSTYFVTTLLHRTQQWSPGIGGTLTALPMVTSVPASVATVTGLEVVTVFTVLYVLLFAFVPLTLYYVYEVVFTENVALFGSFFFIFYHLSFYFTPGKQLISELFLALLLLLFFKYGIEEPGRKLAAAMLAVGLILSHYGMTYVFGTSLVVASVGLWLVRRFVGETDSRVPLAYPFALLVCATAWYAFASQELVSVLWSVPVSLSGQIVALLSGSPFLAEGTGADTVQEQTSLLEDINLYIYLVLTVFVAVGLARQTVSTLVDIHRGKGTDNAEFTALSVPFFAVLSVSFIVILNLWIERVYQMALPLLAPFMPLGYLILTRGGSRIRARLQQRARPSLPHWPLLALLIGTLLLFNSGAVFAFAGSSAPYTFDSNAQDYAFSQAELDGADWIKQHAAGDPTNANGTAESERPVRIYTDTHSHQMFRSVLSSDRHEEEVIRLKSRWRSTFDRRQIADGYVFIRERSILDAEEGESVPITRLSRENVTAITASGDVIYSNGDVRIVKVGNASDRNESISDRSPRMRRTPAPDDPVPYGFDPVRGALKTNDNV